MTTGRALDALNFFLADVRDGLGPYLAVYLLAAHNWDAGSIGVALAASGVAGLLAQAPGGMLVDALRARRGLIAVAAAIVAATCIAVPLMPGFWPVLLSQVVSGAAASVFAPAIAALTLGVAGRAAFTRRTGRNESFNHAGNAFAAATAGGLSYFFGPIVVFWLLAIMAVLSIAAVLRIPAAAIDHDVARGLEAGGARAASAPSAWSALLASRPLLVFAGCVALFHAANAAMLPLVGQKLAQTDAAQATALMSVCIVAAQVVMVPMALLVGARADTWGRKALFLGGFCVLAARGGLYTLSDDPFWLVGVQLLDGVGAGLFGALFPIIVADLTRGTGHFSAALGAIATAQGIGASLSVGAAGFIVVWGGYSMAFLVLAGIAVLGALVFWRMMPETSPDLTTAGSHARLSPKEA
ncbi:MFS transporter [Humitalea sp. 24SJ18S-53]|uniref:MFS transporter n=1 Tax=Humitalea sp. 24SJ18S-53 TaxID=3422307 RepID=UPI003D678235